MPQYCFSNPHISCNKSRYNSEYPLSFADHVGLRTYCYSLTSFFCLLSRSTNCVHAHLQHLQVLCLGTLLLSILCTFYLSSVELPWVPYEVAVKCCRISGRGLYVCLVAFVSLTIISANSALPSLAPNFATASCPFSAFTWCELLLTYHENGSYMADSHLFCYKVYGPEQQQRLCWQVFAARIFLVLC